MVITNIKVEIPRDKVLNLLGYKECVTEKSKLHLVDDEIENGYSLIEPKAVTKNFDIAIDGSNISIKDGFEIDSSTLAKRLNGCSKVSLFLVTVGPEIIEKTGNLVVDVIREAVGSEAVEALAQEINKRIDEEAKLSGYTPVARYSVGYGDWNVSDQPKILNVLGVDFVKCLPNYMMVPKKTVTAIVGWKKNN